MKKHHLVRLLDLMFALAVYDILQNVGWPWPQTLAGLWKMNSDLMRLGASVLWLAALWVAQYRLWDRAERVTGGAVLTGVGQALCVIVVPYMTNLNVNWHKVRLFQGMLGGTLILELGFALLTGRLINRANADNSACGEAVRTHRLTLWIALGIIALGIVLCVIRSQRSVVYSEILSALWMLGATVAGAVREARNAGKSA